MGAATLPQNLRTKLELLARRLHRLRLLRGGSWVVLALVGGAAVALGLDASLELAPPFRFALFAGWVGGVLTAAWRGLIRPLRRPVTAMALAAAVEEEYPRLGERLTSSVELATAEESHGSPAFVELLVRETDLKTRAVDFLRVAPPRAAGRLAAGVVVALLLFAAPALLWPDHYVGLGRRLLMPWDRRPAVMPFALSVTPGDTFAGRGRPLTIVVELQPTRAGITPPDVCTLVLAAADGKPLRLRMPPADRPHAFAFRIDEVTGNYRYHVEAGSVETDTHTILAVDPVELAGSTATLTPPAYATSVRRQTVEGPGELAVLEHGRVAIDCRFDRPAEAANLIVTPAGGSPQRRPLVLANDRLSGRTELPGRSSGRLRLELAAEHGIMTLGPEQTLTVAPDRPPQFHRVAGLPEQSDARPDDALALDVAVADDLAVAAVDVEYRVNAGSVQRDSMSLAGLGTVSAAGRWPFKLAGRVKDGDRLYLRIRAADNRSVPEAGVGPNVVTFPAGDRWTEIRVVADASPVRQQDIMARRDDIERRLRDLIAGLDQAVRRTQELHQTIEQGRVRPEDQTPSVLAATEEQTGLAKQLTELARDIDMAGLTPLAERMQSVGDVELRRAAEAFQDAGRDTDRTRVAPLRRAEAAMAEARMKLEALLKENLVLADERLDEAKLEDLADRERQLAEQAQQAETPEQREQIADEQRRIAEELDKLTGGDNHLREAVRAAAAEQARKLGDRARKLAQAERDLDAKLREAERQRNIGRLADLARRQQELATEADRLANQTRAAAQTARAEPLDAAPAARAAEDLRGGDADTAERRQDQSARELDRLADGLQKGVETATDPREAARQLSRLQEQNRQRLRNRPAERPLALREQEAIRKAVEVLKLPDDGGTTRRDRQRAVAAAADAVRALTGGDAGDAEYRMGQAKDALDRLASGLPSVEARVRRAREEVAKLREAQDAIGRLTDRAEAARKEVDVVKRLGKLDAPVQEGRRARATEAAARALDDLRSAGSPDVVASQQDARRALERLSEALAGKTPADERARQLARRERELAAGLKPAGDPAARQDVVRRQEQIAVDTLGLDAPEAPVRQAEAAQAAIRANTALREKPDDPATRRKLEDAAEALDQLADQLAGKESEALRADRLARKQEDAAQQPAANPVDARRLTNQIAEEAKQVRAGEAAAAAKRDATNALGQAQTSTPSTPEYGRAQNAAAQALRRLAHEMNRQPAAAKPQPGVPAADTGGPTGMPTAGQVRQARDLAAKQRELRDQVRKAVAGDRPTEAEQTAADRTQRELAEQARDLARSLDQTAGDMAGDQREGAAKGAAESARQGERSLQRARGSDSAAAKEARRRAAEALDRAAEQATEAGELGRRRASPNGRPEAGKALQDAKGEMSQAQGELDRGQTKEAGGSMERAANALRKAADQAGRRDVPPEQSSSPAESATAGTAPPQSSPLPKDLQQHAGRKWGELPGELRTRIIQEMKAQYGDDYARVIKLYFEQIAETKAKK